MRQRVKNNRICIAYPNGLVKYFTLLLLVITFASCSTRYDRVKMNETNNSYNPTVSDQQFIEKLNSFDSTATIKQLYYEPVNELSPDLYCIIIKQNDSVFLYKGFGTYFKKYYESHREGDKAKP